MAVDTVFCKLWLSVVFVIAACVRLARIPADRKMADRKMAACRGEIGMLAVNPVIWCCEYFAGSRGGARGIQRHRI